MQDKLDWTQWLFGTAIAGAVAAFGHAHLRINRVEDRLQELRRDTESEAIAGDAKLWNEFKELREALGRHQAEMHIAHISNISRLAELPTRIEMRADMDRLLQLIQHEPTR